MQETNPPKHVHFPANLVTKTVVFETEDWRPFCKKICGFLGCSYIRSQNMGLCFKHLLLFTTPELIETYSKYVLHDEGTFECRAIGCSNPVENNGFCFAHSFSVMCKHPHCKRRSHTRNRCTFHTNWKRCSVEDCFKTATVADHFCCNHAQIIYQIDHKLYEIYEENDKKKHTKLKSYSRVVQTIS